MLEMGACYSCEKEVVERSSERERLFEPTTGLDFGELDDPTTWESQKECAERIDDNTEIGELSKCIEGVNPLYDPDVRNEYSENCGSCALATWLRLEGLSPGAEATANNIGTIELMEKTLNTSFEEMAPWEISSFAAGKGEGWHGLCAILWPNGYQGHWVNLYEGHDGLYVLDGQCGEVSRFEHYLKENPARAYYVNTIDGSLR